MVVEQKEQIHTCALVLYILDKMVLIQMLGISLIEAAACWIRLTCKAHLYGFVLAKKLGSGQHIHVRSLGSKGQTNFEML